MYVCKYVWYNPNGYMCKSKRKDVIYKDSVYFEKKAQAMSYNGGSQDITGPIVRLPFVRLPKWA